MNKLLWTAEQITREVQNRVDQLPDIICEHIRPKVGLATWHDDDEAGRNWNISFVRNGRSHVTEIRKIVDELRDEIRLLL